MGGPVTLDADQTAKPERLDLRSRGIAEGKKWELLELFPEVRTEDDRIDFDRLKLALGEMVDVSKERYGLTWSGKAECFRTIQAPSTGTLRPSPEESVNWDTTENLIVEGDNLQVLKLLQKSYLGKIKLIYIDPPYNTGNDFIYPDDYAESLRTYLEYTGQVDGEGRRFSTNTDTNGRFHSRWLNMMYPRLYLARNLLREDGLIFISIDDNEVDNLRKLCSELFGEENFVAQIVVQSNKGGQDYLPIAKTHEYLLCYSKESPEEGLFELERDMTGPSFEDARGRYEPRELRNRNPKFHRGNRPNLFYAFYVNPNITDNYGYCAVALDQEAGFDIETFPQNSEGIDSCWRWGKVRVRAHLVSSQPGHSEIVAHQTKGGRWNIYEKSRRTTQKAKTLWDETEVRTEAGTRAIRDLFGEAVYDHPKPVALLRKTIEIGSGPTDIVLDFFAGSGTTAQAVLELNRKDGGSRRFVLVQLPEPCPEESVAAKAGYRTIAEITKERVRRVITRLNEADNARLPLGSAQDPGFKVFKLAESNFLAWDGQVPHDVTAVTRQLEMHIDHVREGRTDDDLLYEILLKSGFSPTLSIEKITLASKTVHSVAEGALFICLERKLTPEVVRAIAERKPQRVVCLDAGFAQNDQLKANAAQMFKTKDVIFKTI